MGVLRFILHRLDEFLIEWSITRKGEMQDGDSWEKAAAQAGAGAYFVVGGGSLAAVEGEPGAGAPAGFLGGGAAHPPI